jgi:hypothetical protein
MAKEIDIRIGGRDVGKWIFDENPLALAARRTAEGFRLTLPSKIQLEYDGSGLPQPLVTNVRAEIATVDGAEVGVAFDSGIYAGATPCSDSPMELVWRGSMVCP